MIKRGKIKEREREKRRSLFINKIITVVARSLAVPRETIHRTANPPSSFSNFLQHVAVKTAAVYELQEATVRRTKTNLICCHGDGKGGAKVRPSSATSLPNREKIRRRFTGGGGGGSRKEER